MYMMHNNYCPSALSFNYPESKFLLCIVKLPLALSSCTTSTIMSKHFSLLYTFSELKYTHTHAQIHIGLNVMCLLSMTHF